MRRMMRFDPKLGLRLNLEYFRHHEAEATFEIIDDGQVKLPVLWGPRLEAELGPARQRSDEITQRERDLAASMQNRHEEVFLDIISDFVERTGHRHTSKGETDEVDVSGVVEEQAIGSQRSVDHPVRVGVGQRRCRLRELIRCDLGAAGHLPPVVGLVDEVRAVGVPPVVEQHADVGMIEQGESLCFGLEPANEVRVRGFLARDHLDEDLSAERGLVRAVERAGRADTDRVPQLVARYRARPAVG